MKSTLPPRSRLPFRLLTLDLLAIILIAQLARIDSFLHRWFCADEFEHLHAAWCITRGLVPYRDFFEHHTPLLYLLLAPILKLTHPEQTYQSALLAILLSRALMYILCCLTLYLTYKLGAQLHSKLAGLMAVLFTLSTMMFIDRTTEIRPDQLSAPAMLAALLLTLRALKPPLDFDHSSFNHSNLIRHSSFVIRISNPLLWAGVLASLALLATPKALFWLDLYLPATLLLLLLKNKSAMGIRQSAILLAGLALPLLLTAAIFASLHALPQFLHDNLLLNAHWKFHLNPWDSIHDLAYENPALVALGSLGLLSALLAPMTHNLSKKNKSPCHPVSLSPRHVLPALTLLALIVGIFIIPVPYTEYFLPIIPLLAIYQATLILKSTTLLKNGLRRRKSPPPAFTHSSFSHSDLIRHSSFVIRISLPILALITVILTLNIPYSGPIENALWIITLLLLPLLLKQNLRPLALLILITMLTLFPARRFLSLLPRSDSHPSRISPNNDDQLAALRYIQEKTSPADPIFDGWDKISAPFRPHAFPYFFLHREIRPMLPPETYDALLLTLRTNPPRFIIMDRDTLALPPPLVDHLKQNYHPTEIDSIWARN